MKKNKKSKQKLEKKLKKEKSKQVQAQAEPNNSAIDTNITTQIANSPTLVSLFQTPDKTAENLSTAEEEVKTRQLQYESPKLQK